MLRIRLSRCGRTHLPMHNIVVIPKANRRDGKYIEKIGYHQPTLKENDPFRLSIDAEAYNKWIKVGAQPSEKVKKLAAKIGIIPAEPIKIKPKKSQPKQKAQDRLKDKTEKLNQTTEE